MTIGEWLENLATSDSSTEEDARALQRALRKVGFGRAVVVYGVAYLDGKGTLANPPRSIHAVANSLLNAMNEGRNS